MLEVVGGMQAGADGRIRTHFGHNPSSLRLCSFDPNLQNITRSSSDKSDPVNWVKEIFVAPPGYSFYERDYSGIEAVLVGYFAGSSRYVRLAKLGVHAFLCSQLLSRPADLSWSDKELAAYFKQVKKEAQPTGLYDVAKRCVHGGNYLMTPAKMVMEYPETYPTRKDAERVQGIYFDLFPEIREWHRNLCNRVDGTKKRVGKEDERVDPWTLGVCHVVNPFGYTHRFYNVLDWEKVAHSGGSEWVSSYGEDAKRLVSFLPQSTAAAIIKRAAKSLFYSYPMVGETLRLLIHDSIFGECRDGEVESCLEVSRVVMEAPIEELPLDPAWGMGDFLAIGSEAKVGKSWGGME